MEIRVTLDAAELLQLLRLVIAAWSNGPRGPASESAPPASESAKSAEN